MLNLHSGGELVTYDMLRQVSTPEATSSHVPIPHAELVESVRFTLQFHGHEITEEHHAIDKGGDRYFGILSLRSNYGNYSDVVGLRNSHDKSFPIGVAFGSSVFVCSNLSFVADHVVRRKHTVKARRELPFLLQEIVAPLQEQRISQNTKLLSYQSTPIDDVTADHTIMELYRQEVIGVQAIAHVLREWETPSHDWGDKTAWRIFNAATFALSGKVTERPMLTQKLHEVIDGVCQTVH